MSRSGRSSSLGSGGKSRHTQISIRYGRLEECACKNTEDDTTIPEVPSELAVQMPETIEEYINNRALKKHFLDTFVTNVWVKRVKDSLPFICKCCKTVHGELYKKVMVHILKGGELPSEIVQEEGGNDNKNNNNDKKILACLFCQCTTVTCPVQKRVIDIDKIRENSRIISQALDAPTKCSPRSEAGMVDLANKHGLVPFKRNNMFDTLENLGLQIGDYHLKYLLDDSTLSVSDDRCDVSTMSSHQTDKQPSEHEFKACYGPKDGKDTCYRGKGVMYLIGAREIPKQKIVGKNKRQEINEDDEDYYLEDDYIPVKYRGFLTDDPLYGKDPSLCKKCFKRVEFNNFLFIFRRTVQKLKSPQGTLLCTCELDPYDVLEAEVKEESECQKATKNVRKCEFNILMNNVITKWNNYVNLRRKGSPEPVDDLTIMALEDLAKFFYKGRLDEGLLSPSISYSGVSSASKPSSTDSDIICKIGIIANKLYKKFPPCQAMLEELQEKFNEGGDGEEGGDPLVKIQNYAQELKIRMMPQKISLKKQSGKKKEVYCDTHEKEEMAGLIKYEAEKLMKQNAPPEEEAMPEDEESIIESKPPRCNESVVNTESDEENVERLGQLVTALQRRNPKEDDEEAEKTKPCTCGMPPLIKVTSEDNCKQWIQENWDDGYLIERLQGNEEILVELEIEGEAQTEVESDLADNYKRMVSTLHDKEEKVKEDKPHVDKEDSKKDKEKEKAKKKKSQDKKGKKGDKERPSKIRKKSRRLRKTVPPDQMEAHSLNYRQIVEYLHSRKNVSFKDITRLYKYPVLRLPAPQWRQRNKLLMRLRNRKIMMDDGEGHRMQIFILPTETWQGKVLSKPFISYGMLRRKIMPFRQKYPKWIKPINIKQFKKRNAINEEVLKNLVFPEKDDKGKKKKEGKNDESKDKKDKKKFCRSIRSKYQSTESIKPLLNHNFNVNYYCKEVKDKSKPCFIEKRHLLKKKAKMVKDEWEEQKSNENELNDESNQYFISRKYLAKKKKAKTVKDEWEEHKNNENELNDESNQYFISRKYLAKKKKAKTVKDEWEEHKNNENELNDESNQYFINKIYSAMKRAKTAKDEWEEHKNNENELNDESNQYFINKIYSAMKKAKTAKDEWEEQKNNENENNQWFIDERHFGKKKKKNAASEWEKHKNCETYVVNLVKIPPDVVVKRKYLYKKIMVDPHRKLIVVELKRGEKHHSQSLVRYFIPFIVVSKTRLPTKRKKSDHPNHLVYMIRNAILKQIKTRFRLPSMRVFIRKLIELGVALFKLTMGYEVKHSDLRKLQKTKFELLGYRSIKGKSIENIALSGFNVVMYWLLFKLKVYTLYSLLRSERFDTIMAPMIAEKKPIPENSSEWLEELNCLKFEIECLTLMEIEEYGLESKRIKAKYSKKPSLAKALDKCRQCANPLSQEISDKRALDLFNALVLLVKLLYEYDPPTVNSINAFKLPELIGSDDEMFNAPVQEPDVDQQQQQQGDQKQDQKQQQQQKQPAQQTQIKEAEKKGVAAVEIPVKGDVERGKEMVKIKKWMNYEFEYNIYMNQRSLTLERLIEYIRDGGGDEDMKRKKSIELEHVIPGLLGITVEGLIQAEKEKDKKGKKKGGGRNFLRARSRRSGSCIRRADPWRPTFQRLLVKEIYGLPELTKLKYSKSKKSLRKVRGKSISFGKPLLIIIPSRKPKLMVVKETNSEPIVIAKGELNIAVNVDKTEFRKICTPLLTKLNATTINNLLTKISSQNLVKKKLMHFISLTKHKKKLKPSYSDPVLYKKSNPLVIKEYHESSHDLPKLKRICSADETINLEQNKTATKLINLISDHLEELLTIEILSRQTRKLNSESTITKPKLPMIKKISVEKLIKKKVKRRNVKKVISKKMNTIIKRNQGKNIKSKMKTKDQHVKPRNSKTVGGGRQVETQKSHVNKKSVPPKIGKHRGRPDTPEIVVQKGGKKKGATSNTKQNATSKPGKNQGVRTSQPTEIKRKSSKNLPNKAVDSRNTGKRKCESINAQKLMLQRNQNITRYQSEFSSNETDEPTEYQDVENYEFKARRYCKSAHRKHHIRNDRTVDIKKEDPMKKISAHTILTHLKHRVDELPQPQNKIRSPSRTREYFLVSSDEILIRTKRASNNSIDKKESIDSHNKSYKKKSGFETETSMKQYSSSTLYSLEAPTHSSGSRTTHKKHKHKPPDNQQ